MKNQKHDTTATFPKSNNKSFKEATWIPLPHIHDQSLSRMGRNTSVESDGVKLFAWVETSPFSEMMRSHKCLPRVSNLFQP